MKKVPKSIMILGRKYKIVEKTGMMYQGTPCLGLCDATKKILYLEKTQTMQDKEETLIHEVTHAFLNITGLDQKLSESENEIYCQLITALYSDLKVGLN